jgi:nucleotide-binding universal stress UspA family protein
LEASVNNILVGYDGSESGRDALRLALELARGDASELFVACVWVRDPVFGDALANERERSDWFSERFEEAERELGAPDFHRFQLTHLSAPTALGELAQILRADLLVLGSTHRGPLGRVLPGSLAERFLHGGECAVAVAPRGYARHDHPQLGLVGVGFDDREESRQALAFASRLAERTGGELRAITVLPEGAEEPLSAEPPRIFRRGDPAAALANEGVELDLLVVGSRAYGPLRRTVVGEVSHEVMRSAPCPVVVVPRSDRTQDRGDRADGVGARSAAG